MALDGIFLHFLKQEIEREALGARVEKVSQPSREELVLSLRSRAGAGSHTGALKLLLSVRSNSPRLHFTNYAPDNPQKPPMLCMLLRKTLVGAVLTGLRQVGWTACYFSISTRATRLATGCIRACASRSWRATATLSC